MKRFLLFVILLAAASIQANAQWGEDEMDETAPWKERIFTGGGLGASFQKGYSFVSVSPLIGYKITPKLAAGLQFQYRYTKYNVGSFKFSANDYGISPFLRWNFYGPLFLHTEYEYLNYTSMDLDGSKVRKGYNSFFAGGGFFQPLGRNAGFFLLALYNFSYRDPQPNELSPYDSPLVIRAGVTAGF
ncbi:hypothetical protein [Pseudochryseolinea flava]|uniref:Outer membrane protein beta-barrel domain-containing protein n=1 Tax=Pseudochryseolinea flava TaxID=2059302 RepID=A0A364XTH2_9BACT|nr:hypothetical protein [Pseudochryseolinea flava]RAV97657.1 hypothetical protein DQQ10_27290 [Pseudochryseolinea flava]